MNRRVLDIAHRGASGAAPEHTFAAYDLALRAGADFIEQDLQTTSEGTLVVLHDDTLDRTTRPAPGRDRARARGKVSRYTLAEIQELDAGSWFNDEHPDLARAEYAHARVASLAEVFSRYAHSANYYIETKQPESAPGMEKELVRLTMLHELVPAPLDAWREVPYTEPLAGGHVVVQSFSADSLRLLARLAPAVPRIQLIRSRRRSGRIQRELEGIASYAQGIGPERRSVDSDLVEAAHGLGLHVHPYTVNEASDMDTLIGRGVDGMFTNHPALLARRRALPSISPRVD